VQEHTLPNSDSGGRWPIPRVSLGDGPRFSGMTARCTGLTTSSESLIYLALLPLFISLEEHTPNYILVGITVLSANPQP